MNEQVLSSALEASGRILSAGEEEAVANLSLSELLSLKGGETLLHDEAKKGNSDGCWRLLRRGEEAGCKTEMLAKVNEAGRTALQIACDQGHFLLAQTLLNDGATWICRNDAIDHPFILALVKGDWIICSMLKQHNPIALKLLFSNKSIAEAVLQQAVFFEKFEFASLALEYDSINELSSSVLSDCLVMAGAQNNAKMVLMLLQKGAKLCSESFDAVVMNGGCCDLIMLAAEAGQPLDCTISNNLRYQRVKVLTRLMEMDVVIDNVEMVLQVLLYKDRGNEADDDFMLQDDTMLSTSFLTSCLHLGGLELASLLAFIANTNRQDKYSELTHNIDDIVHSFIEMGAFEKLSFNTYHHWESFLNYSNNEDIFSFGDGNFAVTRHHYDRLITQVFADLLIQNQSETVFAMLQACPSLQSVCAVHAEDLRNDYANFIAHIAITCDLNVDAVWIRDNSAMVMAACSQLALEAVRIMVAMKGIFSIIAPNN